MGMAVRRESVQVDMTGNLTAEALRAAGALALLRREADGINRIRISGSINTQLSQINRNANQTGQSINQLTGRMAAWGDAALILGPGLIPIGAVGTQALMGMVNAAGALAVAGASAVVAFQGLGDAVSAIDDYQADKTAANLEKAQQAMEKLPASAQAFVAAFQEFQPVLTGIRDAAADGWFPGLTDSLDDFERLAPSIEKIFFNAGQAGGGITDNIAESLASDRWQPFMDFIAVEAPSAMHSLARTMGDLAHGFSEMWQAFDPGNDAFLGWLEDVASGFDRWASSAEGREDIEGFLAYARENGPEVAEFFSSLVGALSSIVQAAAPLGGPVLQGLTAIANVIEAIADSDIGTPILVGLAALRAYNRVAAITAATQARVATSMGATTRALPTAAQYKALAMAPQHLQGALYAPRASDLAAQRRAQMAAIGKGAGLAAGGAFLMSGAAEDMNLTNTAMLALIGTMGGPWGAAAGAAAGFALDAAKANNEFGDSVEAAKASMETMDFSAMTSAMEEVRSAQSKFVSENQSTGFWDSLLTTNPGKIKNDIEGMLGKSDVEESEEAAARLEAQFKRTQQTTADLGEALGMTVGPLDDSARSMAELDAIVAGAQPAMDKLGISMADLGAAELMQGFEGSDSFLGALAAANPTVEELNQKIADQAEYMDSAAGRSEALAEAYRGISADGLPAAEKATRLSEALDAMIDPAMNAEAATDAWRLSLRTLRTELDAGAGFKGFSQEAIANRDLTRTYVDGVKQRLVALVEMGASEQRVARATRDARQEFIASGIAAGMSAKQVRQRANEMGLTPKLVRTVFEAVGLVESTIKAEEVKNLYNSLPRNVQSRVSLDMPSNRKELDKLVEDLNLTPKERRTVMRLMVLGGKDLKNLNNNLDATGKKKPRPTVDLNTGPLNSKHADATRKIAGLDKSKPHPTADLNTGPFKGGYNTTMGQIAGLDRATANPTVTANTSQAVGALSSVRSQLASIQSKTVTVTVVRGGAITGNADGGTIPKTGAPYADRHLRLLADGEEVISNRYGQADRHRSLLKAINNQRYADGGTTSMSGNRGGRGRGGDVGWDSFLDGINGAAGGLKGLRARLKESESALQRETSRRSDAMSLRDSVSTSLAGDLFGNGLAGFDTGLSANQNDAKAMLAALRVAKSKGLDGPLLNLLAASGDLATVQQFANLSAAQIRRREIQYGATIRTQGALGDFAVVAQYGKSIDAFTREIKDLQQTNRELTKAIRTIEKAAEKGTERGSARGGRKRDKRKDRTALQTTRARR